MSLLLEKLLPFFNFRIDGSGSFDDLDRWTNDILQPVLDLLCAEAQIWIEQQDIDTMTEQTVDAFLRDMGNPFQAIIAQPLNRKKLFARTLFDLYRTKGTATGLVDVIRAITGVEATVIHPAVQDSWELGVEVLGDTPADPPIPDEEDTDLAILAAAPSFLLYSFQVGTDRILTAEERVTLEGVVDLSKPAHTHFLGFVEPSTPPPAPEHWELNDSFLHGLGEPVLGDEIDLHE